jgi:hypothetical protein
MINTTHHVIGLISLDRSGKDTFFNFIKDYGFIKGYDTVSRFSFSDAMKVELANALSENYIDYTNKYEIRKLIDDVRYKEKFRSLMKAWSETKKLIYSDDYWAEKFIDYSKTVKGKTLTIITDLSFPVEIDIVKDNSDFLLTLRLYNDKLYSNIQCDLDDPINICTKNRIELPVDIEFTNNFQKETMVSIVNKVLDIIEDRCSVSPSDSPFYTKTLTFS